MKTLDQPLSAQSSREVKPAHPDRPGELMGEPDHGHHGTAMGEPDHGEHTALMGEPDYGQHTAVMGEP